METPAFVHSFSTRPFPEKIPGFDYESNSKILKVTLNGAIRWKSYYWVYLTAALDVILIGGQEPDSKSGVTATGVPGDWTVTIKLIT